MEPIPRGEEEEEEKEEASRHWEKESDVEVRPVHDVEKGGPRKGADHGPAAENSVPRRPFLERRISNLKKRESSRKESERTTASALDPPLRTEVVYTSLFAHVDGSTQEGLERGVAKHVSIVRSCLRCSPHHVIGGHTSHVWH